MRARILILLGAWAAVVTLAACGGSDGGDDVAATTQQTVTVTVPEPEADPKAKDAPADGSSSKKAAEERKKEAPVVDLDSGKVDKRAPTSDGGKNEEGSTSGPGPGQVMATNDSPPEVTLAVIDAKSAYVKKTLVARYAGLLDQLERPCREERVQLAEAALTASHDTAGRLSILEVLRQVVAADPSGICGPAFSAVAERAR